MKPVSQPITDYATVQEVFKISQKASKDLQQKFTFITIDLAVAKTAYALVWHHKLLFSDVIIHLGVFHMISAYLKAVEKYCQGVVLRTLLLIPRSVQLAPLMVRGKHYSRSITVHKTVLEALERLLFSSFLQSVDMKALLDNAKMEVKNILSEN